MTISSASQSMAILSGGINQSMQQVSQSALPAGMHRFEGLMNAYAQLTAKGQPLLNISATTTLGGVQHQQGDIDGLTIDQLQSLADIEGEQGAQILQLMRQYGAVEGDNTIVLNLSEKGLSQDIIDELRALFSNTDLITILRDPNLNAQLDGELENLSSDSIETSKMVDIISGLLSQSKNTASNSVTFSADELNVAEDVLKKLIEDPNKDQTVEVSINPVVLIETNKPLQLAVLQQQIVTGNADDQAMLSAIGTKNPFALKEGTVNMTAEMRAAIERALQRPAGRNGTSEIGQTLPSGAGETIADRMATIIGNTNNPSAFDDFSGLMLNANGDALMNAEGEYVMPFEASFRTASQASNPLTSQALASQAHPASQMVAANLSKMALRAGQGEDVQSYRLQLDPPEMGRLDIEMDFIDSTGHLKAVIHVEKPETLSLLQRDMHTLLKAMQDAGFEGMNQNDLSFNLSQGQDQTAWGQNQFGHDAGGRSGIDTAAADDGELVMIDTQMSVIIDPVTGQKHVNMLV